jgi:Tol biopolymer transport system component
MQSRGAVLLVGCLASAAGCGLIAGLGDFRDGPSGTGGSGASTTATASSTSAASSSGTGGQDGGGGPPPRCDPKKPFGEPVPVEGINTLANEEMARLSPDELTIYFSCTPPGDAGLPGYALCVSTRPAVDKAFDPPVLLKGVNGDGLESSPTVTADGSTLVYVDNPDGGNDHEELYIATRSDAGPDFGPGAPLDVLNSMATDYSPYLLPGGDVIYFISRRSGGYFIYRAQKGGGGFMPPVSIGFPGGEYAPVVTADELTIYYMASDDIYVRERPHKNMSFGTASVVLELNSMWKDWPSWVSEDGCVIYLSSLRSGNRDIYRAARPL